MVAHTLRRLRQEECPKLKARLTTIRPSQKQNQDKREKTAQSHLRTWVGKPLLAHTTGAAVHRSSAPPLALKAYRVGESLG